MKRIQKMSMNYDLKTDEQYSTEKVLKTGDEFRLKIPQTRLAVGHPLPASDGRHPNVPTARSSRSATQCHLSRVTIGRTVPMSDGRRHRPHGARERWSSPARCHRSHVAVGRMSPSRVSPSAAHCLQAMVITRMSSSPWMCCRCIT